MYVFQRQHVQLWQCYNQLGIDRAKRTGLLLAERLVEKWIVLNHNTLTLWYLVVVVIIIIIIIVVVIIVVIVIVISVTNIQQNKTRNQNKGNIFKKSFMNMTDFNEALVATNGIRDCNWSI